MKSWMDTDRNDRKFPFEATTAGQLPDSVLDWIAKIWLLYDVPFQYLVPDERFLPMESVRFFHLDQNWIEAMVEGALSIGGGIAAERELSGAFAGLFREKAANRLRRPRRQRMHENHLIKCKAKENLQPETDFMGFLIRSRLVGAYKGMEVKGREGSRERELLRLEALSDTVMIGIFDGSVNEVIVTEPSEGLHFGTRTVDGRIYIRRIKAEGDKKPGDKLSDELYPVPVRAGRTVDVLSLASMFMEKLHTDHNEFTSAEFALEMLCSASEVKFCREEDKT